MVDADDRTRFGKEGQLQAVGETMTPVALAPVPPGTAGAKQKLALTYAIKGRPHNLTIPAFDSVRPRGCTWIWHRVSAEVTCAAGNSKVAAQMKGSRFPSTSPVGEWREGFGREAGPF